MQTDQIIIAAIILFLFFGIFKFLAKAVAIGFLIFIVAPALFANYKVDIDWGEIFGRVTGAVGIETNLDLAGDVSSKLSYAPAFCSRTEPLMFEVINRSDRDVAKVDYQLGFRPKDRSTLSIFRNGTSDYIVQSGKKSEQCLVMPTGAKFGDIFIAELSRVRFMTE
jgi:hypothetical protein